MLLHQYLAQQQSLLSNVQVSLLYHHLMDAQEGPMVESSPGQIVQVVENGRKTSRAPMGESPNIHRERHRVMSVTWCGRPPRLLLWPRRQPPTDQPVLMLSQKQDHSVPTRQQ